MMPAGKLCLAEYYVKAVKYMAKLIKTLQLPIKLVELAKQYFKTSNASKAICSCIEFAIMNCLLELLNESLAIYHLLNVEERRILKSYSVRIEDYAVDTLKSITVKPLSDAVVIAMVLALSLTEHAPSTKSLKLINILGSKWDERMKFAIEHVVSNRIWAKSYETCVGALGIHANFKLSDTELINDDDIEKINLYRCLKENAYELMCKASLFGCTQKDFEIVKKGNFSNASIPNVDRAVRFFIMNFFSARNSGNTYVSKSKQALYNRLEVIAPLSTRLQGVHISNMDIFDVIHKHRRETDTLFIVDPIYLDTNVYKGRTLGTETEHGKEFGWKEHQRLAKELRYIKGDFIYFCRITASRRKNQQNKLIDTPEALHHKDIEMLGRIDDLYWGYGFYYMDVPLDDGTIERIITSFNFEGATPYGSESKVL